MASYIALNGNESRLAAKLRNLIDSAINLQDQMNRVKLIADECGASTADWVTVGAKFGLSAADAQAMYALLTAAKVKINSADVDNFCNRLG